MRITTADLFPRLDIERRWHCHFGLTEGIAAAVATGLGSLGAGGALVGTAAAPGLLSTGIAGGLLGAGGGALLSGIEGQNPLTGALTGALTGGAIGGLGPAIGSATGLGTAGGDILAGAGSGAVGSLVTGQSPLTGALTGGAAGAASGLLGGSGSSTASPSSTVTGSTTTGVSGGTGASSLAPAAIAAPAGPATDLTSTAAIGSTAGGAATAAVAPTATGGTGVSDLLGSGSGGTDLVTGDWSPRVDATSSGLLGKVGDFIGKNPGAVLGAGALGLNLLMGQQPLPAEKQLQQAAGESGSMARALSAPEFSGVLPAGLQSVVDQSQNAAISKIKTSYAQLGLGGSTSEGQAIAAAKQASSVQIAKIADDLAKQGLSWADLNSADLSRILAAQQSQDQAFTTALTSFATGLAGGAVKSGSS